MGQGPLRWVSPSLASRKANDCLDPRDTSIHTTSSGEGLITSIFRDQRKEGGGASCCCLSEQLGTQDGPRTKEHRSLSKLYKVLKVGICVLSELSPQMPKSLSLRADRQRNWGEAAYHSLTGGRDPEGELGVVRRLSPVEKEKALGQAHSPHRKALRRNQSSEGMKGPWVTWKKKALLCCSCRVCFSCSTSFSNFRYSFQAFSISCWPGKHF